MSNPVKISDTLFFCEFASPERKRLHAGVVYIVVDNILDPEGEETQEFYVLAYGYAGGGTEGQWLFKRDSYNSRWVYGDTSGDEWKGARETSKGSHLYDLEVDEIPEWTEQDSECYAKLMELRDAYFTEGEDEFTTVKEDVFERHRESDTRAITPSPDGILLGFDMDILFDISPIWNLTTQYRDPYYES